MAHLGVGIVIVARVRKKIGAEVGMVIEVVSIVVGVSH